MSIETTHFLACEQTPVGDSRVQSRANGMNRWLFARGVTTLWLPLARSPNFFPTSLEPVSRLHIFRSFITHIHHAQKLCAQPQMSYILTYVRVALATSDVQSILELPATDEIHLEDRNQTCVSTATFESSGTKTTNGRINLYIKLEEQKLDQMAERNI